MRAWKKKYIEDQEQKVEDSDPETRFLHPLPLLFDHDLEPVLFKPASKLSGGDCQQLAAGECYAGLGKTSPFLLPSVKERPEGLHLGF